MKRVAVVVAASLLLISLTGCKEPVDPNKLINEQYRYCVDHGGTFSQSDWSGAIRCDMPKGTK